MLTDVHTFSPLQADVSNWITYDNVVSKVDAALENPVSYEYAISTDGKIYQTPIECKYLTRTPSGKLFDKRFLRNSLNSSVSGPQKRMYETSLMKKGAATEKKLDNVTRKQSSARSE